MKESTPITDRNLFKQQVMYGKRLEADSASFAVIKNNTSLKEHLAPPPPPPLHALRHE